MKAIILAAGIASRLRPLTNHTPKCLLNIGTKAILQLTLDHLIENKINDFIIVTGYLEQQIKDFITSKYKCINVHYIYNELYATTNNIYSLWLTKEYISGDDMLLLDSDIIFDKQIITNLLNSEFKNCLALKKHAVQEEEIKVKLDLQGRITQIGKEVHPKEAIGESIGIEKFNADLVQKLFQLIDHMIQIDKNVNLFYEAAFQKLIESGENIYTIDVTEHYCMEIDTAADLEIARQLIITSA